jgi:hypothetical protein
VPALWYYSFPGVNRENGITTVTKPKRPEDKQKPGRRPTGRDPVIPVRLPPEMIEALDRRAAKTNGGRSGLIRQFIEAGLKRRPKV